MNKRMLIAAIFPFLIACSNTDLQEDDAVVNKEIFNLEISYNGQEYKVPCTLDEEGNLIYLDTEFKRLYDTELSQYPNLATLDCGDNKIAYFRSSEEMFKQLDYTLLDSDNEASSRAMTDIAGTVTLWDDTGFKDRSLTININYLQYFACPHLKPAYGFNDKTSALKVWSKLPRNTVININGSSYNTDNLRIVFLGYEDDNYRGKVLCCIPNNDGTAHEHGRLKGIGWNDKITAVRFRIAENGMYTPNDF